MSVRRLDIAILMGLADVDPMPLDSIVRQQIAIPGGELLIVRQVIDRRRQAVASNAFGYAARQMQGVLQPRRERFERLGAAEVNVLPVRIGKHRVEPEVLERLASDGDVKIVHGNEVEGDHVSRVMNLRKTHFSPDAMPQLPVQDPSFQRAPDRIRDTWRPVVRIVLLLQPIQNRERLETRIALQERFNFRPEFRQRIHARAIGPRGSFGLARQPLRVPIFSDCLLTHVQPPCDAGHRIASVKSSKQLTRADIREHGKSLLGNG